MTGCRLVSRQRLLSRGVLRSAWSLILLCACQRSEPPRDFKLELPEMLLSSDPVRVIVRVKGQDGSPAVSEEEHPYQISPAGLANVTPRGSLTCQKSGDGEVSLTWGGNTRKAALRCRLVERVDATDVGRVELTAGAFRPKVRVLGKGDVELDSVDVVFTSRNTGVLVARGTELVPKSVGTATILARAGQAAREFKVDVVRKLTPEALPIDGNRKIHYSLEPGSYELKVSLPSAKSLTMEWRGAPYCNASGVSQEHVSKCVLRTKGGVVFDNPAYLMARSTEVSTEGVTLHEVP